MRVRSPRQHVEKRRQGSWPARLSDSLVWPYCSLCQRPGRGAGGIISKMKSDFRLRVLILSLICCFLGGAVWNANQNKLQLWVSPPLTLRGHTHKVTVLVPAGWKLRSDSDWDQGDLTWVPSMPSETEGVVKLKLRLPGYHNRGPLDRGLPPDKEELLNFQTAFLWRQAHPHTLFAFLEYENENPWGFEATHTAITESLTVE
jgi:hypothetical protein